MLEAGSYSLITEERPEGLYITGYEGEGAVLDLSKEGRIAGIDKKAFLNCRALRKVFLPGSIETIGDWAFSKCKSLRTVHIDKDTGNALFQRGVFEGCESLTKITFSGMDEGTSILLAVCANRMANEHLLRSEDRGEKTWFEKWDLSLLSLLHTDNAESTISNAVSGEEDISYDGVGSVDGEMPGETNDYVKKTAVNKCFLCFLRLLYPMHLRPETEETIREYLAERAFGCEEDWAWVTIKEDCEGDAAFLKLYLSVAKPDAEKMRKMIEDLNSTQLAAKALLINEAQDKKDGSTSALDALFL